MDRRFFCPINAVRFRQRIQRTLNCAAWGLFVAALVALLSPLSAAVIFAVSIAIGLVHSYSDSSAAQLIDRHYHLKDRILTAIALLRRTNRTPLQQLQIDDAAEHIATVKPLTVSPIRLPKVFWFAIGIFALNFAGTTLIHNWSHGNVETPVLVELSEASAALLEEVVAQTEELAQVYADEESLPLLFDKVEALTQRFENKMNTRETLMTLSEIGDAFQTALDSLQLEVMDELLQSLAHTLELAEPTLPIGHALEKGDYSQAALELKMLDSETLESLSAPERLAIAEKMQELADSAGEQNQQMLQEAAQKMSEALKDGNDASGAAAADALASEVEQHGIRVEIGKNLAKQQQNLEAAKAEFGMAMDGGDGIAKSETAKQTWGMGSAGDPNAGQETQLDGERQQQELTGMLNEEVEAQTKIMDSQEMTDANSIRQYREQFQQYQQALEAVLDAEPIPLGQRLVIRRYFESIRPSAE